MAQDFQKIKEYKLTEDWNTSGDCQWTFAEKKGKMWFIKQYMAPKHKKCSDGFTKAQVEDSKEKCDEFRIKKQNLFDAVRASENGNIIPVRDFFIFDSRFFSVSEKVQAVPLSTRQISKLDEKTKLTLLRVLAHSVMCLHKNGVVHADLKPGNVLLKKTQKAYTFKLIDFDASFLENDPKKGEEIRFDYCYVPPEQVIACSDESILLTCKADIFALGALFHEYWTGDLPKITDEDCSYLCAAAAKGSPLVLSPALPKWLGSLISDMLKADPDKRPSAKTVFETLENAGSQSTFVSHDENGKKGFYAAYDPKKGNIERR